MFCFFFLNRTSINDPPKQKVERTISDVAEYRFLVCYPSRSSLWNQDETRFVFCLYGVRLFVCFIVSLFVMFVFVCL